jgi:NADPH2:quinone reductase
VGDEVFAYARKEVIGHGTYAEYLAVGLHHLAHKPKNLSFEEAAVIPLSGLTAYQCLFESLRIQAGETVLIHAGGGGVGGYAIPMAKAAGAHVITTASTPKHEYVRGLGADEIVDYRQTDFVDALKKSHPRGIDAVFDTVGGTTQLKSSQVLKKGGRITSILAIQKNFFTDKGLQADYVFVRPDAKQLHTIKELIENERIRPKLSAVFSLEEAAKAHELIETGHVEGKIALKIS